MPDDAAGGGASKASRLRAACKPGTQQKHGDRSLQHRHPHLFF
jgi:hypothetical protein